jgi:hypothetical protein
VGAARTQGLALPEVDEFTAHAGRGVTARVDGQVIGVGSPHALLPDLATAEATAATAVVNAKNATKLVGRRESWAPSRRSTSPSRRAARRAARLAAAPFETFGLAGGQMGAPTVNPMGGWAGCCPGAVDGLDAALAVVGINPVLLDDL